MECKMKTENELTDLGGLEMEEVSGGVAPAAILAGITLLYLAYCFVDGFIDGYNSVP